MDTRFIQAATAQQLRVNWRWRLPPHAHDWPWRLAAWSGRLLLLSAIAYWWGGYVVTHLFSLAFPDLLPSWNNVLGRLDATQEGTITNTVSAITLASVTLLAGTAAVLNYRRFAGYIAIGGWMTIAVTTALLTFEELAEFKRFGQISIVEHSARLGIPWPVLASPAAVAFIAAMWVFARKGLGTAAARAPLLLGTSCWAFALVHETLDPLVFAYRAWELSYVLEETLEYSGTLCIGMTAAISMRRERHPPPAFQDRWHGLLLGAIVVTTVLGGLVIALLFRAPLVETLAPHTRAGTFGVTLQRQESVVQEFRMPATPVQSLRLLLSNCDPSGRAAMAAVRVTPLGAPDVTLAQGSVEVPVRDCPRWRDIELLPPITAEESQSLALHVAAHVEPGAELRVGATKGDLYPDGKFWVNGALAWPDQNLEFVLYGASEPTLSKLHGIWQLFTSDWRWWALAADVFIALIVITLIPALLAACVLQRHVAPRQHG